jgi:hypothetical protein
MALPPPRTAQPPLPSAPSQVGSLAQQLAQEHTPALLPLFSHRQLGPTWQCLTPFSSLRLESQQSRFLWDFFPGRISPTDSSSTTNPRHFLSHLFSTKSSQLHVESHRGARVTRQRDPCPLLHQARQRLCAELRIATTKVPVHTLYPLHAPIFL